MSAPNNFPLQRLVNLSQAGEGSNMPPRQFGSIRVPIVTNLRILKVENYFGGTTFTLSWNDPDFGNIRVAQYNIFVSGIDGVAQPQGPYSAQKSPAVVRISTRIPSNLVFTVQTQLTNGLTSDLAISTSVAAGTIAPVISPSNLPPSGVTPGTYGTPTSVPQITFDVAGLATAASNIAIVLPPTSLRNGVLLGSIIGANFNSTADQPISIAASKYIVRRIIALNASISLTTADGGVYPSPAKAGTPLVPASQVYTALAAPANYLDLTLEPIVGTDAYTLGTLYFSLTTPQGAPATADIFVFGDIVS